jgi:vitamin-K-epoxide reductase (warfarin-sensitive)
MKGGTSPAEPGGLEKQTAAPGQTVAALCALGCVLGLYAFYVGTMATASPPVGARGAQSGFKAWCDFSTGASCSTVARSQYGVGLGLIKPNGPWGFLALPNSLYGIIYYVAIFFTQLPSTYAVPRARQIALILSGGALFASFYLGYLLVFVIKNLCVVCVATYVVNGALFRLSLLDYQAVLASLRTSRKSSAVSRAKGLVMSDRVARGEQDRAGTADDDKASIEQDKSGSEDEAKEGDEKETGDQAVEGVGEATVADGNEASETAATTAKTAADDEGCAEEKDKKDASAGNKTSKDGDEEKVDGKAGKR